MTSIRNGHSTEGQTRKFPVQLADIAAPGAAFTVAEEHAEIVGITADIIPFIVPKAIAERIVAIHVNAALPNVAMLIAKPDGIAVPEAAHRVSIALHMIETCGQSLPASPAPVDHAPYYGHARREGPSGRRLSKSRKTPEYRSRMAGAWNGGT